jgi:hypothetical protein
MQRRSSRTSSRKRAWKFWKHWIWSALACRVLYANQPPAWVFAALFLLQGASFFWRRGRARTSVVRPLAQRVGASGVGRDRVLAAVLRVNRSLPTDHVRASFLNSGIDRTT